MAANAPWSVKGIDPETREAAKESARLSGLTLGEWLNQRIREEAQAMQAAKSAAPADPAPVAPEARPRPAAMGQATPALAGSLSALSDRLIAAEQSQTEARRLIEERLARVEQEGAGPRSAEALRVLEASVSKVAHRAHDAEARLSDTLDELKRDIAALSRRLEGIEASPSPSSPAGVLVLEQRMEQLAVTLTARVDAAKAEMSARVDSSHFEMSTAFDAAKVDMAGAVEAAGARSAQQVERIGNEVLRMADTLGRRVQSIEDRSADAIEQVGGEVARVISTLEGRLQKSESAQSEVLEKLSGEIARISEKLTERIAQSERRAAQAIDDVGEQVSRTTERMNSRYDRASSDLAERIRQSEERTARLLEEARERIDSRLAEGQRRLSEQVADVSSAPIFPPQQAYAERAAFSDPYAPAPPVIYPDAAPFGQTFAPADFAPVEPDFVPADIDAADNFVTAREPQTEADFISPPIPDAAPELLLNEAPPAYEAEPAEAFVSTPAFEAEPAFETPPAYEPPAYEPAPFNAAPFNTEYAPPPAEPAPYSPSAAAASTRNMLEQARAAARAAAQPQAKAQRGEERRSGKTGGGLPFLGRKNKLKNSLMVGAAVLALGAAFGGFYSLNAFKGSQSNRLANGLQMGVEGEYRGSETDTTPRAAMALDPKPIEGSTLPPVITDPLPASPNAVALYNDGATRIEAGDKTGVEPLKRAANLGLPSAQAYLGRLYEKGGAGLVKSPTEARRWYERAAQAGDRGAMHNLGYYYFEGTAGPKNLTVAAEWFRRAGMLGLTDSQYNLARLYEGGLGVSQNPAEAYKWYLLASRGGSNEQRTEARTAANRVGATISDEARANAERTVQIMAGQISTAQDHASASGAPVASTGDVASTQRALTKLGFYRGAVDGQMSAALNLAIQSYQREKNMPATGQIDAIILQSLRPYMS